MCIFEYNEELHLKSVKEEGLEEGIKIGHDQGIKDGETRFARLLQVLNASGRSEDANRAIADPEYREMLYQEFL